MIACASFGTRDSFRSPREREDSREIADWIVAQSWSNGVIGATGISYVGAAADFLASTGHAYLDVRTGEADHRKNPQATARGK